MPADERKGFAFPSGELILKRLRRRVEAEPPGNKFGPRKGTALPLIGRHSREVPVLSMDRPESLSYFLVSIVTTLFAFSELPVARCRSEIALFSSVCARSSLLRAVVRAVWRSSTR